MRHGTKLATALAVTLTVFSGIAAVGATMGVLTSTPDPSTGKVRLVDRATPERREDTLTGVPSGEQPSGRTQKAGRSDPGGVATGRNPVAADSAPTPAPVPTGTVSSAGSVSPPAADHETEASPPPTTAPTAPVVDPGPPALDCHSSDDGMSEAEKQARERACAGGHGDD